MSIARRCDKCEYGHTIPDQDKALGLHCLRYPPAIMMVPYPGSKTGVAYIAMFPKMSPETWCGEFEQKRVIQ